MMDPLSIVGLIDTSLSLAVKCVGALQKMNDIASKYKHSKLNLLSLTQFLKTIECAWKRIRSWTESYNPNVNVDDDDFVLRMTQILETGTMVMAALAEDLSPFDHKSTAFGQRAKLIWNASNFLDHQTRIRDQAYSMGLLLQAIQLPTPTARGNLIRNSETHPKKSDESAYSVVPSQMSSGVPDSIRHTDDRVSIRSEEDIVYRHFSFEDELFTAQVYKRNYRHPMILRSPRSELRKSILTENPVDPVRTGSMKDSTGAGLDDATRNARETPPSRMAQIPHISSESRKESPQSTIQPLRRSEEEDAEPPIENPYALSEMLGSDEIDEETPHPRSVTSSGPQITDCQPSVYAESDRSFMSACEEGNLSQVQKSLGDGGCNVHSRLEHPDSPGFAAIHFAVMGGHVDVVRVLLEHGSFVEDRTTTTGSRPLHLAAQAANQPMIKLLLEHGAQVSARNLLDEQPLHSIAKSSDSPSTIHFLAKMGADINASKKNDGYGCDYERPLNIACRQGFLGNVNALLTLGADTAESLEERPSWECPLRTALRMALMSESRSAPLELLLKHGAQNQYWLGPSGKTPLHMCIETTERELFPDPISRIRNLVLLMLKYQDINSKEYLKINAFVRELNIQSSANEDLFGNDVKIVNLGHSEQDTKSSYRADAVSGRSTQSIKPALRARNRVPKVMSEEKWPLRPNGIAFTSTVDQDVRSMDVMAS